MPRLLLLAALMLAGCSKAPESFDNDLKAAHQWLSKEQFGLVSSHADEWLRLARERHDLRAEWRFRLLKAEASLGQEKSSEQVLKLLTGAGEMPSGDDWAGDRAQWLILRARATYSLGRASEVPALLDLADEAAARARRPDLAAEIELRRGFLLKDNGKFEQAQQVYDQVLAESRKLGNRYLEARVENSRGTLLVAESRYDEAIPILEHGQELATEIGASDTAARVQGNLGICYFRLGDFDNARARFDTAESEFAREDNQFEVQIWTGNAANLSYETGDLQTAMNSYRRALTVAQALDAPLWTGRWLTNLASISIERHDWQSAERYNDDALALKAKTRDAEYQASCLVNAAQIAAGLGDLDKARALFDRALHQYAEDPDVILDSHAGLAGIFSRRGRMADTESEFRNTLAEIDRRQAKLAKDDYRLSWLDSLISFYRKYVDFLIAQKQPDRALEAAESSRSKVLTGQPIPQLTASGYRQLARKTGAVLLEYWLGPDHSYVWVVTPEKIVCHELQARNQLLPLIRAYRAVVTGGRNPLDSAYDTGMALYNALLAPAMQDAGSATQFIIVPDDELNSLNFETLPDGNNANRFWIDRATLRISPSLNYLASNASRVHEKSKAQLLLIGDPVSSLPQYPHLEFASREMSAIAGAMSASRPVVVQGESATPASYAAEQPGRFEFIHFSAHASAATKRQSALDSAVILSGPPDQCRLLARDVLSIPLHAELVTVSACRSAGGKTYGGEGLVGFAWAFMKAGADNVIAGLWDVNDQSTVRLMTGLYSGIAKGESVAEALRSSKLALIHGGGSYARPFYWAPFQVYTARP